MTVRSYKTRKGRLGPQRAAALERLLPVWGLRLDVPLDPVALFGRHAPLVLEVGAGLGEATVAMAAADPGRDVLAVEVHTPGLGALLLEAEALRLTNVRVAEGDAVPLLRDLLGPGSLDEVRVFFPDPWPKVRHAKRRLVGPAFLALVAGRLRPGGTLHVATDWAPYADGVLVALAASPDLELVSRARGARPVTRFEARGLAAGRAPHDLVARRR